MAVDLIAPIAVWLGLVGIGAVFAWMYALRVERRDDPVPQRLRALNGVMTIFSAVISGAAILIGLIGDVPGAASDLWPALLDNSVVLGIVVAGSIVAMLGVITVALNYAIAPSIRRIRGLDETAREGVGGFIRSMVFLVVPFGLLVFTSTAFVGNVLVRTVGTAGTFIVIAALGPLTVRWGLRTYAADDDIRRRILEQCARHGVEVRDVRLFHGRAQKRANALFVGIVPSRRYIYVSDYLVDNFTGAELDAVMAHEICHGKEHHLVIRVALTATLILVGGVTGIGLLPFILAGPLLSRLGRRFERRADDYAARTVGNETTVSALRHLAVLNDSSLSAVSRTHPSLAQRIKRLGGHVEPDEETPPRRSRWSRRARLPLAWRITLGLAWPVTLMLLLVFAAGTDDTSYYSPVADAASIVLIVCVFVMPFLGGFGWRWAPAVSIFGALCGLLTSWEDAQQVNEGGVMGLIIFAVLITVSIMAARDPRVLALTFRRRRATESV